MLAPLVLAAQPEGVVNVPMIHFCRKCERRVDRGMGAWRFCPDCGARLTDDAVTARPECRNYCPPGYTGHWNNWHRGHGCHLDDGRAAIARAEGQP